MSKKDKERAKKVQAICAEIRNTIFDNDGNAVGKYSDKNIIFDETGIYPIGKKLKDGNVVYFNIYKGKEKHEIKEDKDMENYIVINGKKAELTKEQLEKLGIKIENLEEKYPAKFKVGDRVKVTRHTRTLGRGEDYEGRIVTIKTVYKLSDYPDGPAPNIRAYSIGRNYVVYENELELCKAEDMFKREHGELYQYIGDNGDVLVRPEYLNKGDDHLYNIGNYCKDEKLMEQRALHETLNRLLWRASVIAGELDNEWNMSNAHYYIYRDFDSDCLRIDCNDTWKNQDTCYFPTEDSAHDALGNIVMPFLQEHPDFKW